MKRSTTILALSVSFILMMSWPIHPASGKKSDPTGPLGPDGRPVTLTRDQKTIAGVRQKLGGTDEEWAILTPKVLKVKALFKQLEDLRDTKLLMQAPRPPKEGSQPSQHLAIPMAVSERAKELREVMDNPNAQLREIQVKLEAFRVARVAADRQITQELASARQELRELLTVRQETALVMMGILD